MAHMGHGDKVDGLHGRLGSKRFSNLGDGRMADGRVLKRSSGLGGGVLGS